MTDRHNDSIQEHLTNSIRRAKQRIYSKAISAYSNNDSQYSNHQYQMRDRTNSERSVVPQLQKEDKSIVASAMKVLQERIATLELQNRDLKKRLENAERQSKGKQIIRQKDDSMELSKALSDLKAKQLEVKKITKQNGELHLRYSQLNERMQEVEEELEKVLKSNKQESKFSKIKKEQNEKLEIYEARILQKNMKIAKLQQAIKELEKVNISQKQSIQNLSKKVQEEKKMNLKWIKMYNSQLDKKQNRSIAANQIQSNTEKKSMQKGMSFQVAQIHRKNKQLQQTLQRNKIKIADLNRQRKKAEDKCFKIQQIALQIADQITKSMSNPPSHLKYLTAQIMKLEGGHFNDSAINCSRKSRLEDRSGSKQRKRSLKMQDLNSSSKKSKSRSKSKIIRKMVQKQSRYIIPDELLQN